MLEHWRKWAEDNARANAAYMRASADQERMRAEARSSTDPMKVMCFKCGTPVKGLYVCDRPDRGAHVVEVRASCHMAWDTCYVDKMFLMTPGVKGVAFRPR